MPWKTAAYWFAPVFCSSFFLTQLRITCPGSALPQLTGPPTLMIIEGTSRRLSYGRFHEGIFSVKFLFPDKSILCQIVKKLTRPPSLNAYL